MFDTSDISIKQFHVYITGTWKNITDCLVFSNNAFVIHKVTTSKQNNFKNVFLHTATVKYLSSLGGFQVFDPV